VRVTVVIPLKALSTAKGRLADAMEPDDRKAFVAWMAQRVITACRNCDAVADILVVAGDDAAAAVATACGVRALVVAEPGLDAAMGAADAAVAGTDASLVIAADLPELTPSDVEAVIRAAPDDTSAAVVIAPTHDGGTGALLRRPPTIIATAYGPGSARGHETPRTCCRRGYARAASRGAGPGSGAPRRLRCRSPDGRRDTGLTNLEEQRMPQGTVKYFDTTTNTGTVLLDNQEELPIDRETFAASGLLELRLGQRVRFELEGSDDDRRVRDLNLVSFS
jgi:2-phospho-L-lactate guanylyltransferase